MGDTEVTQPLFCPYATVSQGRQDKIMSKGGNIKQWNTGQGDRALGLEGLREGKKGLVTVVAKEK